MGTQLIIITGNLGKDPETFTFESGDKKTSFSVAVSESYKDKQGNKIETTEWFNVVATKGLASVCEQYLKKGSKIYLEGKLRTKDYEKDGEKRKFTELIAYKMTMLSTLSENQGQPQPKEEEIDELPF